MSGNVLELPTLFGKVSAITRIIHFNVKGGSVLRILQLWWSEDTFFFNLFKDGFGEMIHSAGVNSLDFGFAGAFVSPETMGFGKRGIALHTSKASTVFG